MSSCFVIMPFGEKIATDGELVNFDTVYRLVIKETLESMGITCIRANDIRRPGWIHADMFRHIFEDDIAVVDITTPNANVFYELGIRHTLRSAVTVLIKKKGTQIPFNIQGFRVIDYDLSNEDGLRQAQKEMAEFVRNGLKQKHQDSPVHQVLHDLRITRERQSPQLTKCQIIRYRLKAVSHKWIALITGEIQGVKVVDIWVNSENTNMQMARYFDHSISGIIRYLGAKKDIVGYVLEDTIADELATIMGAHNMVPPATIIVTGSGELAKTHNVKKIFHVAAVTGRMGKGYSPIPNIDACITEALKMVDSHMFRDQELTSILFPLLGTGTGRGKLSEIAHCLIQAAIAYLEAHPQSTIECVYFSVYSAEELAACQAMLQDTNEVEAGEPG